jgi:hypothetical protein
LAGALFSVFIVLPFAHQKKMHYDEVSSAPFAAFCKSLDISFSERFFFVEQFWADRIDGARELAYVEEALGSGRIHRRNGLTYWEAVQQLVPRLLWSDKPMFNLRTNYYLARELGLLAWDDPDTSWGVNFYAEAVWNFGATCLLWFVPLAFFVAQKLDLLILRQIRMSLVARVIQGALFFRLLDVPGLVSATTMIVWILVLGKLLDIGVRRRSDFRTKARPRQAQERQPAYPAMRPPPEAVNDDGTPQSRV